MNWWRIVRKNSPPLYFDLDQPGVRQVNATDVAKSALRVTKLMPGTALQRMGDPPRGKLVPSGIVALEYTVYMEGSL